MQSDRTPYGIVVEEGNENGIGIFSASDGVYYMDHAIRVADIAQEPIHVVVGHADVDGNVLPLKEDMTSYQHWVLPGKDVNSTAGASHLFILPVLGGNDKHPDTKTCLCYWTCLNEDSDETDSYDDVSPDIQVLVKMNDDGTEYKSILVYDSESDMPYWRQYIDDESYQIPRWVADDIILVLTYNSDDKFTDETDDEVYDIADIHLVNVVTGYTKHIECVYDRKVAEYAIVDTYNECIEYFDHEDDILDRKKFYFSDMID